jgi:hypothetical protein
MNSLAATLKKQAHQNYKEYDRLATELNMLSGKIRQATR